MENKHSSTIRFLIIIIGGSLSFLALGAGIAYFYIKNEKESQIAANDYCKTLSQEERFDYYAVKSISENRIFKCEFSNKKDALPEKTVNIRKNSKTGNFERDLPNYERS